MTVTVELYGRDSVIVAMRQNCAFLNYALSICLEDQQFRVCRTAFDIVATITTIAKITHKDIVVEHTLNPLHITVSMPDEIYTLTQLKFSEHLINMRI